MKETEGKKRFESCSINKFDIEIRNEFMDCRVFWARVVSSENESLLTQYTKHTFYEVQYALEGRIVMLLGENEHVILDESDFIIIPPDTYHQIVDGDSVGARFIVAFSVSMKNKKMEGITDYLNVPTPYPETSAMRDLLSMILVKNYHDEPVRKRIITALMESFLLEIIEIVYPSSKRFTDLDYSVSMNERRVNEITSFIHDYNGINIQVIDIARKFNISERHLNRIFQSVTGNSLKDVIHHEKLTKIEELIASTELSLGEIAAICGFSDEYAMNKFFRRYNLVNLSDFRRLSKKKTK